MISAQPAHHLTAISVINALSLVFQGKIRPEQTRAECIVLSCFGICKYFFRFFSLYFKHLADFELGWLKNILTVAESADSFNGFAVLGDLFNILFSQSGKA